MKNTPSTDLIPTLVTPPKNIYKLLKTTGHAPFTEKRSKGSKNISGLELEKKCSLEFHAHGTPLLVSSLVLRSRFLGQIDLARFCKSPEGLWKIEVQEVKSSLIGEQNARRGQYQRIFKAQVFLSSVFGFSSVLVFKT